MNKSNVILGCVTLVIIMLSCSKAENPQIDEIVVLNKEIHISIGETDTIKAITRPTEVVLAWSINSPAIATIDQQGVVTGVAAGSTNVIVKYGNLSESILVEVYQPLTDIVLSPSELTVELKIEFGLADTLQYTAKPIPSNSTESLLWKSSDTKVATVNRSGLIFATGAGNAVVTVEGSAGKIKKEIAVSVGKFGGDLVQFDPKLFNRSILPGDNYQDRNEWWFIESIWSGNRKSGGGSSCALEGPQSFTFDMGQTGLLAYFHLFTWQSIGEGYPPFSESNVKKFEVWGCETLDRSGSWDSWTKLMDCVVIKPSGLPEYEYNDKDMLAYGNGQRFYNREHYNIQVRYIRVKVLETWGGLPCWRISQIELYGELL